jgi:hypothetical protein
MGYDVEAELEAAQRKIDREKFLQLIATDDFESMEASFWLSSDRAGKHRKVKLRVKADYTWEFVDE